jgi:hypothetical protein
MLSPWDLVDHISTRFSPHRVSPLPTPPQTLPTPTVTMYGKGQLDINIVLFVMMITLVARYFMWQSVLGVRDFCLLAHHVFFLPRKMKCKHSSTASSILPEAVLHSAVLTWTFVGAAACAWTWYPWYRQAGQICSQRLLCGLVLVHLRVRWLCRVLGAVPPECTACSVGCSILVCCAEFQHPRHSFVHCICPP